MKLNLWILKRKVYGLQKTVKSTGIDIIQKHYYSVNMRKLFGIPLFRNSHNLSQRLVENHYEYYCLDVGINKIIKI